MLFSRRTSKPQSRLILTPGRYIPSWEMGDRIMQSDVPVVRRVTLPFTVSTLEGTTVIILEGDEAEQAWASALAGELSLDVVPQ